MSNKSDNPGEKVRKISGYLDDTKRALVTTTETVIKEGNNDMLDKKSKKEPNVMKEAITPPISSEKKIDIFNKTEKPQAPNKTVDITISNKTDKVKSIDKSRYTQRTDTENTVNKSGFISRPNLSNKSTIIKKPSEIDMCKDNLSVSVLSGHGEILSGVTPDQQRIPQKNKVNKNSHNLIIRK